MATGSRVELIAFPSGEKLKSLEGSTKTHAERPAFSPDGHLLAVGYGDRIALWSVPDGRLLRFLGGYRGQVASLLFSADSKTLVGWGETKFWHLPTFRETLHLETQSNVSRPWIPLTGEQFVCFRNDSVSWEVAALAPLEHSEEWLRDQPASLTEARRIVNRFPPRDPKTPPDLIALDAWYSLPFDRDFLNGALGNGLATLPCGVQLLKQTAFDIRAVVMPNQSGRNALQVGRTCARLRFLHNSFGRETQAGRTIGRYVIHYADGQMAEVPLLIGRNIQNWWADPAGLASSGEAEVAWVGANPRTGDSDQTIHLLILTWQNPRPEVAVRAVDFEKAGWDTQPFLVALTAE
jgi:hypothetical protein